MYSLREPTPVVSEYKYELPGDTVVLRQELFVGNVRTGDFKKVDVERWRGQLLEVLKVADVHDGYFLFARRERGMNSSYVPRT